jgi:hypothetical protein
MTVIDFKDIDEAAVYFIKDKLEDDLKSLLPERYMFKSTVEKINNEFKLSIVITNAVQNN